MIHVYNVSSGFFCIWRVEITYHKFQSYDLKECIPMHSYRADYPYACSTHNKDDLCIVQLQNIKNCLLPVYTKRNFLQSFYRKFFCYYPGEKNSYLMVERLTYHGIKRYGPSQKQKENFISLTQRCLYQFIGLLVLYMIFFRAFWYHSVIRLINSILTSQFAQHLHSISD